MTREWKLECCTARIRFDSETCDKAKSESSNKVGGNCSFPQGVYCFRKTTNTGGAIIVRYPVQYKVQVSRYSIWSAANAIR